MRVHAPAAAVSLRWRIALALAAIAAATTISVGVASYQATSTRLLEEVDTSLYQAWSKIDANPRGALSEPGLLRVYVVQLVEPDGTVRPRRGIDPIEAGPGPEKAQQRTNWWSYDTVDVGGEAYRVISGRWRQGDVLQVGRPLAENESVLHDLRRSTVLLVVLVTVVAAAIGWLIARTVTGPLTRLTKTASDVERSGRLDVEVPVGGKDEVGQLGAAFNGMLGALAASRDDQRRLVEDAGHELRTPLTSVRTNLAVLRRHPDLDPQTRAQIIDDLHAETEELVALVEEVVALARGSTDGMPPEVVSLGDMARGVAARAQRRHGRSITVLADDSLVEMSPPALERAISNLLDNAAKFDPTGDPIEVVVVGGRLMVNDRGPGIATDDAGHVFDRFYRAEDARALPGSGLGLSIVREIVERAGGTVDAGPRPGGGATVGFRLPLVTTGDDSTVAPLPPPAAPPAPPRTTPAPAPAPAVPPSS